MTTFSICDNCSYDKDKKIKPLPIYEKCKTKLILNISLPNILLFLLELSDEFDQEIMKYRNLNLLKNDYKHLFLPEIIVENNKYKLLGTINYANSNHYNAIIIDNFNKRNNLLENENYIRISPLQNWPIFLCDGFVSIFMMVKREIIIFNY